GDRVALPQPPLRRAGAHGGADLGRRRAPHWSRARAGQLLPAPRDHSQVRRLAITALATIVCMGALVPARASASVSGDVCKAAGAESKVAGGACNAVRSPGRLLSAGKNL